MKKSLKIFTSLSAIASAIPISMFLISCENKEAKKLENTINNITKKLNSNELREDQKVDLQTAIKNANAILQNKSLSKEDYSKAEKELNEKYEKILSKPIPENPKDKVISEYNNLKKTIEEYTKLTLKYDYLKVLKEELEEKIADLTNKVMNGDSTVEQIKEFKENLNTKFNQIKEKVIQAKQDEAQKIINQLKFDTNKFASDLDKSNLDNEVLYLMESDSQGNYKDFQDEKKSRVFLTDFLDSKGLSHQKIDDKFYTVKYDETQKALVAELSIENKKYSVSTKFKFDSPNIEEFFNTLGAKIKDSFNKADHSPKTLNYSHFDLNKKGGQFLYENDETKPDFVKFLTIRNQTKPEHEKQGKALITFIFSSYDNSFKYEKQVEYNGFKIVSTDDLKTSIMKKITDKTILSGTLEANSLELIKTLSANKNASNGLGIETFGYIKVDKGALKLTFGASSKKSKNEFKGLTIDKEFIEAYANQKIVRAFKKGGKNDNRKALEFALNSEGKVCIVFMFKDDSEPKAQYIPLEQ